MSGKITTDQLCETFLRLINQYGRLEKELHTAGMGGGLRLSEIHTIAAVGNYGSGEERLPEEERFTEYVNITKLAEIQGISKSAVSQMVSRLVQKGYMKKALSPATENEVSLSLTQKGKEVWAAHERQHAWLAKQLEEIFSHYPEGTMETLVCLASDMEKVWEDPDRFGE